MSANEEHVHPALRSDSGAVVDLEDRVHHYCLLTPWPPTVHRFVSDSAPAL